MIEENKNKLEGGFEKNESNLGKNPFVGLASNEIQKPRLNEDLIWMRGVESGLILMDRDLKEIEEGKNIELNREVDQDEKEMFWQKLDFLSNQEVNEENIDDVLALAKIGESLRSELAKNIEEKSAEEKKLQEQIHNLEEDREKIRKKHWSSIIPFVNVAYIFRPDEKLKKIIKQINAKKDDLYILSSRKQKDEAALKKIEDFYTKNTPEKLFAAKAGNDINKIIDGALQSIEKKYENKIEKSDLILWDLTRSNFKKELLINVGNLILDKSWESNYRKILEVAIRENESKVDQEKIVNNQKHYYPDPEKWKYGDSDFFMTDYDDFGQRKVRDFDWKNYREIFANAPMIKEILDGLENKIARNLMENEFTHFPTRTKEIVAKIVDPEKIVPYLFLRIKHSGPEGNGFMVENYLEFLKEIKDGLANKEDFYRNIKQDTSVLKVTYRRIAYTDNSGLMPKWNPDDEFIEQDAEQLRIFFDPRSMFNQLRDKMKEKPDQKFLGSDLDMVRRQEKYSRLLLEKNIATEEYLAGFYNKNRTSLDVFTKKLFALAENREEGDQIFLDFKDDLTKKMSFGEATLKGWDTILEKTNLSREKIWQNYFESIPINKKLPFDPQGVGYELDIFSKMAAAGYCQEKILLEKFEEQLLDVATWNNTYSIFAIVKNMPELDKKQVQTFFHKMFDKINYQRPDIGFENWILELDGLIDLTATDKDSRPNWEIDTGEYEKNNRDITTYRQMIYRKYTHSLLGKIYQTGPKAVENAATLSRKSGISLEKIYAELLAIENEEKLEKNQIFQNLLAEGNETLLIKYIAEISGWRQSNSEGQQSGEEMTKKITDFLTKCSKKNRKAIVREMVYFSRLNNREENIGEIMSYWLINSSDREKNFNPNILSAISGLLSFCQKNHWNIEFGPMPPKSERTQVKTIYINRKNFNWQATLENIKKQMQDYLGQKESAGQFFYSPAVNRKTYQDLFGKDIITRFLNCLPKSPDRREQSDQKTVALDRGKYDRVTPWLQLMNKNSGLVLTATSLECCGDFIEKYGLNEEKLLFDNYRDLWTANKNQVLWKEKPELVDQEMMTRIKNSGLASLDDLEKSKKQIEDNLVSDKFELDITKLNNFEKAMLDSILGVSSHGHSSGKIPLDEVIANFLQEKDKIKDLTEKHKIFSIEVKKLGAAVEIPQEDKEEYLNIVSQIKDFRKTDWRKIWAGMIKKLTGEELTTKEFEQIDDKKSLKYLLEMEQGEKYGALAKRIIWNTVLKKDYPSEEIAQEKLKGLGNTGNIEQTQSLLENNVLEHAILGHREADNEGKNSLQEIWGDELAAIISKPEKQKWLVDLFASDKDLLTQLRQKWQEIKKASGMTEIKFVPGRDFLGSAAAYIGDACYSKQKQYMSTYNGVEKPLVVPYRIIADKKIIGSVLIFELKDDNAMLVRAFNMPKHEKDFNIGELIEKFLNGLEVVAKEKEYGKIIVPGKIHPGSISNYPQTKDFIINTYTKEENKIELKQEFDFNGYPLKDACYIAR